MRQAQETRYARVRDRQVAYQVVGDGPIDVLLTTPAYLPIDLMWDEPSLVRFLDRLSTFSRCICSDLWGIGASEPRPRSEARLLEAETGRELRKTDQNDGPAGVDDQPLRCLADPSKGEHVV